MSRVCKIQARPNEPKQSWDTARKIALEAGVLKQPIPLEDIVDLKFVKALTASSAQ
jgi:hypothetical protein